jgi:hypothetical protein
MTQFGIHITLIPKFLESLEQGFKFVVTFVDPQGQSVHIKDMWDPLMCVSKLPRLSIKSPSIYPSDLEIFHQNSFSSAKGAFTT